MDSKSDFSFESYVSNFVLVRNRSEVKIYSKAVELQSPKFEQRFCRRLHSKNVVRFDVNITLVLWNFRITAHCSSAFYFCLSHLLDEKFDTIMTQCCTAGEEHASKEEHCRNFKPPTVSAEMISACLYSSEICCATRLRINRCKAGVLSAKEGLDCHSPNNETGSEFYKNCCEACKVGLILGAMQESCTMELQYGSPFDDSFNYCCNEMKATDDTIVLSDDSKCEKCAWISTNSKMICDFHFFVFLVDLCSQSVGLCEQICEDTGESQVQCKCEAGYRLKDDKRSCEKLTNDSDESTTDVTVNGTE